MTSSAPQRFRAWVSSDSSRLHKKSSRMIAAIDAVAALLSARGTPAHHRVKEFLIVTGLY